MNAIAWGRLRIILITAFILVLISSFFLINPLIQKFIVNSTVFAMATTKVEQPVTELYFENIANLPLSVETTKVNNFSFTVHNLEKTDKIYTYIVTYKSDMTGVELNRHTFTLRQNEYKTFTEIFGPIRRAKAQITVTLSDINENSADLLTKEISFWVNPI